MRSLNVSLMSGWVWWIILLGCSATPPIHQGKQYIKPQIHKVLITGFYDWRDLGDPPEFRRCRDNPSCRMLAGEGIGPRDLTGPLTDHLRKFSKNIPQVHVEFALLPVTWESAKRISLAEYDQVIHLGLGVYDSFHRIIIESGAYNYRRGSDAAGLSRDEVMISEMAQVLHPTPPVRAGLKRALNMSLPSPFRLIEVKARPENVYLCNETHYRSLNWLYQYPKGRLKEAYFLHIPHRKGNYDQELARALAQIVTILIHSPLSPSIKM